jgi:hypothetical protein
MQSHGLQNRQMSVQIVPAVPIRLWRNADALRLERSGRKTMRVQLLPGGPLYAIGSSAKAVL